MGMIGAVIFFLLFMILALAVIISLRRPGSRYRLKKDYGMTDREIDQRFGNTDAVIEPRDLKALEEEKKKQDRVA